MLILLLGYLYFKLAGEAYALVSIGLISFAAVAQFAPAILGGIFWKGGTRLGALSGLQRGLPGVVLYPAAACARALGLAADRISRARTVRHRAAAAAATVRTLRPRPDHARDDLEHDRQRRRLRRRVAVGRPERRRAPAGKRVRRRVQAVRRGRRARASGEAPRRCPISTTCWRDFSARRRRTLRSREYANAKGLRWPDDALVADAELVNYVEVQLAGAIGAASARVMVASVVKEEALTIDEVREILDEASQVVVYSHRLEQKSRELEAATAELARGQRAAEGARSAEGRFRLDGDPRTAHAAHVDPRVHRDPASTIPTWSRRSAGSSSASSPRRRERLTRLINQVLDLAKIESGKADWVESGVDMKEVISDTLAAMDQLFKEKNIEVDARLPERVSAVNRRPRPHDPGHAQPAVERGEVLRRRRTGRVEIVARRTRRHACASTCATTAAASVRRITRRSSASSTRCGDTLTDKPHGSGLGLHISRQIVEHFGGRMWVESTLGAGARFSFTLPTGARGLSKKDPDRRRRTEHRRGGRVPAAAQRLRGACRAQR